MGGRVDGFGRGRRWPVALAAALLLPLAVSGCGWLFGSDRPSDAGKARPGVDAKAPATGLPAASGAHDAGIAATDPVGPAQVGGVIPAKGGQKAQKEAADKEAAERDAKDREERQRREENDREAKAAEDKERAKGPKPNPENPGLPGKPTAAVRGNPEGADKKVKPAVGEPTGAAPAVQMNAPVTAPPVVPSVAPPVSQPVAPPAAVPDGAAPEPPKS